MDLSLSGLDGVPFQEQLRPAEGLQLCQFAQRYLKVLRVVELVGVHAGSC